MSAFVNFYLLSKADFDSFCTIAHLVAHKPEQERAEEKEQNVQGKAGKQKDVLIAKQISREHTIIGTQEELDALAGIKLPSRKELEMAVEKRSKYYGTLWGYLKKHGKCPYEYNESGYDLSDLLVLLKETKHIDLTENTVVEQDHPQSEFYWHVLDKDTKDKYLPQLDPANFTKDGLTHAFIHSLEEAEDQGIMKNSKKMTKEELKDYITLVQEFRKEQTADLPNKIKAMLEGVKIIHDYLNLVDDKHVVVLNIG